MTVLISLTLIKAACFFHLISFVFDFLPKFCCFFNFARPFTFFLWKDGCFQLLVLTGFLDDEIDKILLSLTKLIADLYIFCMISIVFFLNFAV